MIDEFSILKLLFILLFTFASMILLLVLVLLILRIFNLRKDRKFNKFQVDWENKLFSYLGSEISSDEFVIPLRQSEIPLLLKMLRGYLHELKGSDFKKLTHIINSTEIYYYLEKNLKSNKTNKVLESVYFLGSARMNISLDTSRFNNIKTIIRTILNKTHSETVFINSALSLARMNAFDAIDSILERYKKLKNISRDSLFNILIEFDIDICKNLHRKFNQPLSDELKLVCLSVFRHFKFTDAVKDASSLILFSYNQPLIIEALRYLSESEYTPASNVIKFLLLKSSPDIISQAIKSSVKISNPKIETMIYDKLINGPWQIKLDAAEALYSISEESREKLKKLAYSPEISEVTSVSKMVISENEVLGK
ncbi:hypothetical protein ACFLS9_07195 [Bacteroidota bacterium]